MMSFTDEGSGLPVVLIHGFPLNREMWQPQVEALSDAGYRVICPDLPGFGRSPLIDGPVSMSAYADAVIELLDSLGVDRAVVGGMSMGGYVLLNLAERYPDRLLGAMFLVTRAAADDEAGKKKRSLLMEEVASGNRALVPEAFAQVLFAPETAEHNLQLVALVRSWMEAVSSDGVIAGLLAMRDRDDFVHRLPALDMPALVIGAEHDLAVPHEHAQLLAKGLPNAELVMIPNAGHMANLEQPMLFNNALLAFLERFDA